ncbi:hypothetical protein OXX79_008291 [Metschnikowia pulcherrima]
MAHTDNRTHKNFQQISIMHLLFWLVLLIPALAYDTNHVGYLFISQLNDTKSHINLRIYGNKLYISENRSRFDYDVRGFVALSGTSRYLGVERGKLKLLHRPFTGFRLEPKEELVHSRAFLYNGEENFELCDDYSIRFHSNCRGSQRVKITFRDRLY